MTADDKERELASIAIAAIYAGRMALAVELRRVRDQWVNLFHNSKEQKWIH